MACRGDGGPAVAIAHRGRPAFDVGRCRGARTVRKPRVRGFGPLCFRGWQGAHPRWGVRQAGRCVGRYLAGNFTGAGRTGRDHLLFGHDRRAQGHRPQPRVATGLRELFRCRVPLSLPERRTVLHSHAREWRMAELAPGQVDGRHDRRVARLLGRRLSGGGQASCADPRICRTDHGVGLASASRHRIRAARLLRDPDNRRFANAGIHQTRDLPSKRGLALRALGSHRGCRDDHRA